MTTYIDRTPTTLDETITGLAWAGTRVIWMRSASPLTWKPGDTRYEDGVPDGGRLDAITPTCPQPNYPLYEALAANRLIINRTWEQWQHTNNADKQTTLTYALSNTYADTRPDTGEPDTSWTNPMQYINNPTTITHHVTAYDTPQGTRLTGHTISLWALTDGTILWTTGTFTDHEPRNANDMNLINHTTIISRQSNGETLGTNQLPSEQELKTIIGNH